MKTNSIETGKVYELKVGKGTTTVTVESCDVRIHGTVWMCRTAKGGVLSVADAKRFLREVKPKAVPSKTVKTKTPNPEMPKVETTPAEPSKRGGKAKGQLSGLESAYVVLKEAGEPLNVKEITDRAIAQKLWEPAGATPAATVAAAIMREMKIKGDDSRFFRADRGLFAAR